MKEVEGNKLISDFMELNSGIEKYPFFDPFGKTAWREPKYHSSWDWLMPAVKKWNDLVISKRTFQENWTKWQYKTVMLRTEIEPVFNDLVSAIQWYKTQSK